MTSMISLVAAMVWLLLPKLAVAIPTSPPSYITYEQSDIPQPPPRRETEPIPTPQPGPTPAPVPVPQPIPDPGPAPTPSPTPAPVPAQPTALATLLAKAQQADNDVARANNALIEAQSALTKAQSATITAKSSDDDAWKAFMAEVKRLHPEPLQPPVVPSNFTVTLTGSNAVLTDWNDVQGATSYTLRRSDSSGVYNIVWSGSGTRVRDNLLNPGTTYAYEVAASNSAGSSPSSTVVTVTIPVPAPPLPPASHIRVLATYNPLANLGESQWSIIASPAIRKYLDGHCLVEKGYVLKTIDNVTTRSESTAPSYRFIASTVDANTDMESWRKVISEIEQQKAPWLRVWNEQGVLVIDQELPSTVDATLSLLQKFGGK